jgi:hypothetical protein
VVEAVERHLAGVPGVVVLRDAARSGYPCGSFFERDPWLEPLHARADWGRLMAELREESRIYGSLYAGFVATRARKGR